MPSIRYDSPCLECDFTRERSKDEPPSFGFSRSSSTVQLRRVALPETLGGLMREGRRPNRLVELLLLRGLVCLPVVGHG